MELRIDLDHLYKDAEEALLRRDYVSAFPLYRRLAEVGQEDCYGVLGWLYLDGAGGAPDHKQAHYWLQKSAEYGDKQGQFYLAKLYWFEGNAEGALKWLEAAKQQGYAPAYYRLGRAYEDGCFVSKNKRIAMQLFKEAADKGHVFAQNRYGFSLMIGHGGLSQVPMGLKLYLCSVVRGARTEYRNPNDDSLRI